MLATSGIKELRHFPNTPFQVYLADDGDGPRIGSLVRSRGFAFANWEPTWTHVWPHWIVAEMADALIGAINIAYSRPVGRLELMAVDRNLPHRIQAQVVSELLLLGQAVLRQAGSEAVMGTVPFELDSYRRVLENRGGIACDQGTVMVKRLV